MASDHEQHHDLGEHDPRSRNALTRRGRASRKGQLRGGREPVRGRNQQTQEMGRADELLQRRRVAVSSRRTSERPLAKGSRVRRHRPARAAQLGRPKQGEKKRSARSSRSSPTDVSAKPAVSRPPKCTRWSAGGPKRRRAAGGGAPAVRLRVTNSGRRRRNSNYDQYGEEPF